LQYSARVNEQNPDPQPSLLILDDEEAIAYPIAKYFRSQGWRAEIATEAEEAEALVEHRRYDMFILDLRLSSYGGAEGLEVLRGIRRSNPVTPVVILSAFVSDEMEAEARRSGADHVLSKPQPLKDLAGLAARLVGSQLG